MGSCERCKYKNKREDEVPCVGCIHNSVDNFKPMTQADRIRSMTDEEMAKFLFNVNSAYAKPCMTGEYGHTCKWEDYPTHDKGCKDCFLEWLKSEAGCE